MDAVVPEGARFIALESAFKGLMPIDPEGIIFVIRVSFICGADGSSPKKGVFMSIPLSN
jgi:hypothetical protein